MDCVKIEDLIDKDEIENLMKSKFYAGFSLDPKVIEVLKDSIEDDYSINLLKLDETMKEKRINVMAN